MNRGRTALLLTAVLLLGLFLVSRGLAEEPAALTKQCSFQLEPKGRFSAREVRDDNYRTYSPVGKGHSLVIRAGGRELGSVTLRFYDRATATEVWAECAGEWVPAGKAGTHLSEWVALPEGTTAVRLTNTARARMFLAEVDVYGPGERPADSPQWVDLERADLLVAACHPDDELLWLGGLLPTYAGERGYAVQVVYAVSSTPERRLELLDGLWHCGVTGYPAFLGMRDVYSKTLAGAYKKWNKNTLVSRCTTLLRRLRPLVVVTHDFAGEYGHGGHRAVADAVAVSLGKAADPAYAPAEAERLGTWQVRKCYMHLYGEGRIRLDWHRPLGAFGGKDGMTVAREAMAMHRSQTKHGWAIEEGGDYDNTLFGLYHTEVGPDEAGDDLFEHIRPEEGI